MKTFWNSLIEILLFVFYFSHLNYRFIWIKQSPPPPPPLRIILITSLSLHLSSIAIIDILRYKINPFSSKVIKKEKFPIPFCHQKSKIKHHHHHHYMLCVCVVWFWFWYKVLKENTFIYRIDNIYTPVWFSSSSLSSVISLYLKKSNIINKSGKSDHYKKKIYHQTKQKRYPQ